MFIRPTIQIGDPQLKVANKKIVDFTDPKLHQLVQDLTDSMRGAGLIGMAAPQMGENYHVFVTEPRETEFRTKDQTDQLRVYINPKIVTRAPKEIIMFEGCGSVLNGRLFGPVKRSQQITVEAFDAQERKFRLTCDGLLACIIQHEMDHLNGIEFLEKAADYTQIMATEFYVERIKNSPAQKAASHISIIKHEFVKE